MSMSEFRSQEDRIGGVAPRPRPLSGNAGSQRAQAGARPAIHILKTCTVLVLIAISALGLRLLLSLPNGIVH